MIVLPAIAIAKALVFHLHWSTFLVRGWSSLSPPAYGCVLIGISTLITLAMNICRCDSAALVFQPQQWMNTVTVLVAGNRLSLSTEWVVADNITSGTSSDRSLP